MAGCGGNPLLSAANDIKGSMKDLMAQGKDALGDLDGLMGDLQSKLSDFKPEIPENETLKDLTQKLKDATSGVDFAEIKTKINDAFGEVWDTAQLEELGLGSYPPSFDEVGSFFENETGLDLGALATGDLSTLESLINENPDLDVDLNGLLSGDFSSLGIDLPSSTNALCDKIPNFEEQTNAAGEKIVKQAPEISKIAVDIPPISVDATKISFKEIIEAMGDYRLAGSSTSNWVKIELFNKNNKVTKKEGKLHAYWVSQGWIEQVTAPKTANYLETFEKLYDEAYQSAMYILGQELASTGGFAYSDYKTKASVVKQTFDFSDELLEAYYTKHWEGAGLGTFVVDTFKSEFELFNDTTVTLARIIQHEYENAPGE